MLKNDPAERTLSRPDWQAALLPVLDLLDRRVVHAVAGEREKYRPITSMLCESTDPLDVARAIRQELNGLAEPTELYVADLDAIAGCHRMNAAEIEKLRSAGFSLWLDIGFRDAGNLREKTRWLSPLATKAATREARRDRLIIASETLSQPALLHDLVEQFGDESVAFSLDLRHGRVVTPVAEWQACGPLGVIEAVVRAGVRQLIVLDVAAVGTGCGPATIPLCREVHQQFPKLRLISGGGIRHAGDVQSLLHVGCERVLVASSLHRRDLWHTEKAH